MDQAICYNAFIPMRSEPSEKSEMVSQVLFGEQVLILNTDKTQAYSLVRNCFDDYEGWCTTKLLNILSPGEINSLSEKKTFITRDIVTSLKAKDGVTKLYIGAGSSIHLYDNHAINIHGSTFFIPDILYAASSRTVRELILSSAKKFINIPYLWGGRSSFGTDCSGFVQNIFKQVGFPLPRDAKQQALCGELISFIDEILPGDILFFGNMEEEISHTGIYIGNNKVIHASGRVKVDSIDHQGIFSTEKRKYTHELRIIKRIIGEF